MKKSIVFLLLLSIGCSQRNSQPVKAADFENKKVKIDSAEGMAQYLHKQNLPAVKSIELVSLSNNFGQALKINTEHYEIYTTLFEPLILNELPAFLESCFQAYEELITADVEINGLSINDKFPVYLFADRTQWELFTVTTMGSRALDYIKIRAGAYYHNGWCVAYNLGTERTFRVLGHECWHQFADKVFKFRLPSWLNEGIAMQFEANSQKGGFFYFTPGKNQYRLVRLKQAIVDGQLMPLKDLLGSSPGEVMADSDDGTITIFYSQCYALIRFLFEGQGGKYRPALKQMLADGLSGSWPISIEEKYVAADRRIPPTISWNKAVAMELFEHYVADDFKKIEPRYLSFCKRAAGNIHIKQITNSSR